jgi:hypothetical protein
MLFGLTDETLGVVEDAVTETYWVPLEQFDDPSELHTRT